jgi:hypothetical protein
MQLLQLGFGQRRLWSQHRETRFRHVEESLNADTRDPEPRRRLNR